MLGLVHPTGYNPRLFFMVAREHSEEMLARTALAIFAIYDLLNILRSQQQYAAPSTNKQLWRHLDRGAAGCRVVLKKWVKSLQALSCAPPPAPP